MNRQCQNVVFKSY